eukprot:6474867-Amphidinium_carterae.1
MDLRDTLLLMRQPWETTGCDALHQVYPHKILTGRRDRIYTLRQGGGPMQFQSSLRGGQEVKVRSDNNFAVPLSKAVTFKGHETGGPTHTVHRVLIFSIHWHIIHRLNAEGSLLIPWLLSLAETRRTSKNPCLRMRGNRKGSFVARIVWLCQKSGVEV